MRVAIVGDAVTTRHLAPFDDGSWQVWAQGAAHAHVKRADVYFELHGPALVKRDKEPRAMQRVGETLGTRTFYYNDATIDAGIWDADAWTCEAIAFPFRTLLEWAPLPYFTSSIAWLVAYAIYLGAEEIGLWGVEMDEREEYFHQRACVNFWLGAAMARGIKITLPPGCVIMARPFLYGLEDEENAKQLSIYDQRREVLVREQQRLQTVQSDAKRVIEQCHARNEVLDQVDEVLVNRDDVEPAAIVAAARAFVIARHATLDGEITKAEERIEAGVLAEVQVIARIAEADFYRTQHTIPEAPPKPRPALEAVS